MRTSKTNYVLVDYENVQPKDLSLLNGYPVKVIVFLGANQAKIPVEFAQTLQDLGTNAEYVRISGNGSNALDFHIAFTIGVLSQTDPDADFYIISKDTGFDPLIDYLRTKGRLAQRSKAVSAIPLLKPSNTELAPEKLELVVRNLASRSAGRPRTVKTLSNTINALLLNALDETAVSDLIRELEGRGHISIDGKSVSYHLPASQ